MCGIVGFLSHKCFKRHQADLLRSVNALHHRGPDDTGVFVDAENGIGLGHRRLSIIDLSDAGRQPMASEDGQVQLVYNGEVYNHRNVRETLVGRGYAFRGHSDSEVILKAYLEWGVGCLEKFVGMFALAIWDNRKRRLLLARDPVGVKPLYYYRTHGLFLFSSELKGIMAFDAFAKDVDVPALSQFLHYQYIPAPSTIFKKTFKLLPGTCLVHDGNEITIDRFWRLPLPGLSAGPPGLQETEIVDGLDDVLTQAVADQLVSDVPLGALLSGGIDSSLVVALMQKVGKSPARTFSIGFNESGYNEAPWAGKIAAHLGTVHTELYVTPQQVLDLVPRIPEIYDEPFADASAVPTSLVCQLTRSQVKVALSGDGGDEQYAGYVRYWMTQSMSRIASIIPPLGRKAIAALMRSFSPSWAEKIYLPLRERLPKRFQVANFAEKWRKFGDILTFEQLEDLYRSTICLWPKEEVARLCGQGVSPGPFEEAFQQSRGLPVLSRLMWVDQNTYLPDAMLVKVDRASMASGLEVRVPLLDQRALAFVATIPIDWKYRNGSGKYVLKRLLARYVPAALFERPKMGFGVPIDRWLRSELRPLVADYLSYDKIKREQRFDPAMVQAVWQSHLKGDHNHQYRLWALLMWEMWRERWLESN